MQFRDYSEGLADLIYNNTGSKPLTVGIFGGFGRGKTATSRYVLHYFGHRDFSAD